MISFIQHPGKGRHVWKENRLTVSRNGGRRGRLVTNSKRECLEVFEIILCLFCGNGYMTVCIWQNSYSYVPRRADKFYLCTLYLNKPALETYSKYALTIAFLIPSIDYIHMINSHSLC